MRKNLLVCAKALSSAYIPISALMIGPKVYEAIERQSVELGLFGLTMTYSGRPVASAVALETLKIYEEEGVIVRAIGDTIAFCPPLVISASEVQQLHQRFRRALDRL